MMFKFNETWIELREIYICWFYNKQKIIVVVQDCMTKKFSHQIINLATRDFYIILLILQWGIFTGMNTKEYNSWVPILTQKKKKKKRCWLIEDQRIFTWLEEKKDLSTKIGLKWEANLTSTRKKEITGPAACSHTHSLAGFAYSSQEKSWQPLLTRTLWQILHLFHKKNLGSHCSHTHTLWQVLHLLHKKNVGSHNWKQIKENVLSDGNIWCYRTW